MSKILYAAGTMDHIRSFHMPYIEALRSEGNEVKIMAKGVDADFNIGFVKKMLSPKNIGCRRKIKKILKAEKFDAIVLNTTLAAFHIRLCLSRKKRPKVINFVHGYMFPKNVSTTRDKIFTRPADGDAVFARPGATRFERGSRTDAAPVYGRGI